jgi:3-hydroxyacyl-CoA dehydrogenase
VALGKVAVIGAGLIGRSWAMVFARAGWSVALYDPVDGVAARALALIDPALAEQQRHGLVEDAAAARARIAAAPSLAAAVADAALVQECAPERVEAKIEIFDELDRHADAATILASSTSAIVASRFTAHLAGRARCLVAHPVNPPHLVPLVELCPAPWTDPATVSRARELYAAVGQVPILVKRELEGFVLNRLQGALLAEAFRLVGEGVVSREDCDRTVKDGLGLRWSFLGPFATIELNAPGGIADYCARYTGFYRRLSESPAPPAVWDGPNVAAILAQWRAALSPAEHEAAEAERDRRLAALRAHKAVQERAKHE